MNRNTLVPVVLGALALGAALLLGREAGVYIPRFALWVEGQGALGPLVFVLGYVIATVAFVPGSLLTLAGGAIFGLTEGVLCVFTGATVGSIAAFLVARYGARAWVERKLEGNDRFRAIDRAIGDEGLRIVVLLRLSPVMPFNLLNYALGLTHVRLRDYALASIGMLPGSLLYVYYGRVIGDVAALAAGAPLKKGAASFAVLAAGLVATILVTALITRTARKALADAVER